MAFRSILTGAVVLVALGVAKAQAQFPPPNATMVPPSGASPFPSPNTTSVPPPAGGGGGFAQPGGGGGGFGPQSQEMPPCVSKFMSLKDEREKRMSVTQATMGKKPSATEACQVLTRLYQSEVSMQKYVEQQTGACPFPPNLLDNIKQSMSRTDVYRKQACTAANAPKQQRGPSEPSLSDAFSQPTYGKNNTKTGSGTLDSLYGNPLAR